MPPNHGGNDALILRGNCNMDKKTTTLKTNVTSHTTINVILLAERNSLISK